MSRPTERSSLRRCLAVTAIGVTTAIALSACTGTGNKAAGTKTPTSTAPAPRGVITRAEAGAVLDHYQSVNNSANAKRSAQLLSTIETGTLLAQDKADYALWNTWSKTEQKTYGSPFTYVQRRFWIPAVGSGATWFAVTATASTTKTQALLIFEKGGGSTYKMTLSLFKGKGESIPEIAVDRDGFAVLADPADPVGGIAPTELSDAFEDCWETGGKRKCAKLSASTEPVRHALQVYRTSEKNGTADGYATKRFFAVPPASATVYALRAADGGVVAAWSTAHKQESLIKAKYRSAYDIVPDKQQSVFGATRGPLITDTFLGQGLALLTSKSAAVTNVEWQLTNAR
ncbi:hypothetical protein ABZX77_15030 [Streptomyces sp. NPDC004237]|uniref:hypothetical protein n=1 Tax=Streptomyces sp. NPDC004237 TaxID=3154455 RepID=UPI0033AF91DE